MNPAVNAFIPLFSGAGKTGSSIELTAGKTASDPFAAFLALVGGGSGTAIDGLDGQAIGFIDPEAAIAAFGETSSSGNALPLVKPELSAMTEDLMAREAGALALAGLLELPGGDSVKAELLSDTGRGDRTFLIKLSRDDLAALTEFYPSVESEATEDALLPARLRTVEKVGGHWIVTADLLQATEKTQTVRIRLDLVRPQLPTSSQYQSVGRPNSPDRSAHNLLPLDQLLNRLQVQSIDIDSGAQAEMFRQGDSIDKSNLPVFAIRPLRITNLVDGGGKLSAEAQALQAGLKPAEPRIAELSGKQSESLSQHDSGHSQAEFGKGYKTEAERIDLAQLLKNGNQVTLSKTEQPFPVDFGTIGVKGDDAAVTQMQTEQSLRFFDIDDKLHQLLRNPGRRIQIQLTPPRLGQMQLSIGTWKGAVTIRLVVESEQARALVEKNFHQLDQKLTAAGIKVDGYQLDVQNSMRHEAAHGQHRFDQYQDQNGQNRDGSRQKYAAYRDHARFQAMAGAENFEQTMLNYLA